MNYLILLVMVLFGGHQPSGSTMNDYDVLHYDLSLILNMKEKSFHGSVEMKFQALHDLQTVLVHASHETLVMDSVFRDNTALRFHHHNDTLVIDLDKELQSSLQESVTMYYHGKSNFLGQYEGGGMYFSQPNRAATISEPSYARTWWPCKDIPSDKATASVTVTVPESLIAVSNGILASTDRQNHLATFHWKTDYPIATYLIAVSAAPYKEYSMRYNGANGDSMKIDCYVFPEDSEKTRIDFQNTATILDYFSKTFCEYPFIKEKFGLVEVDGELTMENQTICSIQKSLITGERTYELSSLVHETAHQWWGNLITPKNWKNTWLSEGFAEYAEALYLEHRRGHEMYLSYIEKMMAFPPGSFAGSITGQSDTAFWDSFAPRVYHKGALVLHMLRGMMGDSLFFSMMREYLSNPALRYGNAETSDFIACCERSYGKPLDWFFNEWIYASADSIDRPTYEYSWKSSSADHGYNVTIEMKQPDAQRLLYRMPISITFSHRQGEHVFSVVDSMQTQSFTFSVPEQPDSVFIDKENNIFKSLIRKEK